MFDFRFSFSFQCFLFTSFVYLHAAKWLLAVLVNTSGWHLDPGNQAVGKLGGSALNVLLKIIPKLSMNYPPELLHSCLAPSIDATGRGRVLDREVRCPYCPREIWIEQL